MKIIKRVVPIVLLLIVILGAGAYLYVSHISRRGLPDYNLIAQLEGLEAEVTVYRDSYGIPHIYAENERDLYRVTGFVMAQDRLWQMDLIRRATSGRLSEIFGEKMVETDRLMRSLRVGDKSKMVYESLDRTITEQLDCFTEGVNSYIELRGSELPPEFSILGYRPDPWHSRDSLNLISYMAWDLTMAWAFEPFYDKLLNDKRGLITREMVAELLPDLELQKSVAFPEYEQESGRLLAKSVKTMSDSTAYLNELGLSIYAGSNNWAVSGEHTASGRPLLANDMHLSLFSPGIWYQMHQVVRGKVDVTGLILPGAPYVVAGHNREIAWGMTNVMVDDLDFYLETMNPLNPNQYLFNGEWRDLTIRKETIGIKGGGSREIELKFTHRGPIISDFREIAGKAVSFRWVGNDESNELRSTYLLNRAGNWEEFKEAVSSFKALSQNIIYADRAGNIGLYCCAAVPIRKGGGLPLVPGDTDEYDWQGMVPFEELPHIYNPPSGIISSANNRTAGDNYPYYISRWYALSHRNDRIRELLESKSSLTIEDFRRIQNDETSGFAGEWREELLSILSGPVKRDESYIEALSLLKEWDLVLDRTSGGAALFMQFYKELQENIYADELGEEFYSQYLSYSMLGQFALQRLWQKRESSWCDDIGTVGQKESFEELVVLSFKDAVDSLKRSQGNDPARWRWGSMHRLKLKHPLGTVKLLDLLFNFDRGPFEVGGGLDTVNNFSFKLNEGFNATHGASHRHLYSLADWDSSLTVIPTGTSGIAASPHYCDQSRLYSEQGYHNDYFSEEKVIENAAYKMVLSPGESSD